MKLFVGLGNPGKKYLKTRHNAGYLLLERIADEEDFRRDEKFKAQIFQKKSKGESLIFAKPETFMNLSGEAVSKIMEYYKIGISELFVLLDDVDIPLGQVRIRLSGSSAGHKGLQNIIDALGSDQFCRVRIGIGDEPEHSTEHDKLGSRIETKQYVLGKFSTRETGILDDVISLTAEYLKGYIGSMEEVKATTLETRL
jgi:PTH1 family peptidyl-tRNA hydrolase